MIRPYPDGIHGRIIAVLAVCLAVISSVWISLNAAHEWDMAAEAERQRVRAMAVTLAPTLRDADDDTESRLLQGALARAARSSFPRTELTVLRVRPAHVDQVRAHPSSPLGNAMDVVARTGGGREGAVADYDGAMGKTILDGHAASLVRESASAPPEAVAYAPIRGDGGEVRAVLRVTASLDRTEKLIDARMWQWAQYALLAFLGVMLAVIAVTRRITRSLRQLADAGTEFGRGQFDTPIRVRGAKEVNQLADALENARKRIVNYIRMQEQSSEAELSEALRRAQAANVAKSQFLANMSHELRTPMNAIIGYSEMLTEELTEAGEAKHVADLDKILRAARHLLQLINDILDLTKIEAGKMDLYIEDFVVEELVTDVVATVGLLVAKNHNTIETSVGASVGMMHGDLTRVRQILFNLLSNAAKFTEHGKILVRVARTTDPAGDWILFTVKDTGIGMTAEQIERAFAPFTQADASTTRKYGGTGLGLTLCREFVTMMGGTISATSTEGQGTSFLVRVPAVITPVAIPTDSKKPSKPAEARPSAPPGEEEPPRRHTVVVIDDDGVARDLVTRYLTKAGYQVFTATGGEEGVALVRKVKPDAVTLDVLMPGMDGWSVIAELKSDPVTADIPVIMTSMIDNRGLGFALEAADYIIKPFSRNQLLRVLARHIPTDATLLVVEDDAPTRALLTRAVAKEGFRVLEAENGIEALRILRDETPDIIVLDLMMPEMDGFAFLGAIKDLPTAAHIPVIVVTAMDLTDGDRERLTDAVQKVVQKSGYQFGDLLDEIRRRVAPKEPPAADEA